MTEINIKLYVSTLAVLIAGLYSTYSAVDPMAIPHSLYLELAEYLVDYLENWDYEKISFEDWIKYNLVIAPLEMFSASDFQELKENDLYIERSLGNVTLVATAKME